MSERATGELLDGMDGAGMRAVRPGLLGELASPGRVIGGGIGQDLCP